MPTDRHGQHSIPWGLLLACFAVSGACALVDEVVAIRLVSPLAGGGSRGVALVISLFMAGLAIGAAVAPRCSGSGLRLYGWFEIAIGTWIAGLPWILETMEPVFGALYRWDSIPEVLSLVLMSLPAAVILLPPTILMGATFPLIGAHYQGKAGFLYGTNTLGAVLGTVIGGLVLMPRVGLSASLWTAAGANVLVGMVVLAAASKKEDARVHRQKTRSSRARRAGKGDRSIDVPPETPILAATALSAAAAMSCEIGWERILALSLGSSSYSLTLVLATFIGGLALGALLAGRCGTRNVQQRVVLAQLAASVMVIGMLPVLGNLPVWIVPLFLSRGASFEALMAGQSLVAAAVLLPPATLLGAGFPLLCQKFSSRTSLSRLSTASTAGSVAGSLLAGFLLVPALGLRGALTLSVAVLLTSSFLLTGREDRRSRRRVLAVTAVCVTLAIALPGWKINIVTSGPFLYSGAYSQAARRSGQDLAAVMGDLDRVLYHRDGAVASVTVRESPTGNRALYVNGKVDASNGLDMATQVLVGHLGPLLHPDPRRVLVVGLGSGVTLGAVEHHAFDEVTCLELSPEIVEASRYFSQVNRNALEDPRLKLLVKDARTYMKLSGETFDVISSEPSNPWVAGMADLFTREYFQDIRERLAPGGIVVQWVQAYNMALGDFRTVLSTFSSVFPECTLWEAQQGMDYLMVGWRDGPAAIDGGLLARKMTEPGLARSLAVWNLETPEDLLGDLIMGPEEVRALAGGARVNTADLPVLEFSAPRGLYEADGQEIMVALSTDVSWPEGLIGGMEPPLLRRVQSRHQARQLTRMGVTLASSGEEREAGRALRKALELAPWDPVIRRAMASFERARIQYALQGGNLDAAAAGLERYLEVVPGDARAALDLAALCNKLGRGGNAITWYRKVLALEPRSRRALRGLGDLYYEQGLFREAVKTYEQLVRVAPGDALVLNNLGILYKKVNRYRDAVDAWESALARDPGLERARENLRIVRLLGYVDAG